MMNASFRAAFWAMCLGLTVPMMLYVGVELTSGGRPTSKKVPGSDRPDSLQAQWNGQEAGSRRQASPAAVTNRQSVLAQGAQNGHAHGFAVR